MWVTGEKAVADFILSGSKENIKLLQSATNLCSRKAQASNMVGYITGQD